MPLRIRFKAIIIDSANATSKSSPKPIKLLILFLASSIILVASLANRYEPLPALTL